MNQKNIISKLTLEEKIAMIHAAGLFRSGAVKRLNIPSLVMSDGPSGVRQEFENDSWTPIDDTTDFVSWLPSNTCLCTTWNPNLCGRNFEYMSEDPHLTGRIAAPLVQGIQSQDVAACVKHFALNNQECDRLSVDTKVDDKTLFELYLPAFYDALMEGGSYSVMGAYNKYDGEFCCENATLLKKILRDLWHYDGVTISDWGGVHNTEKTALNGVDMEMSVTPDFDDYKLANPLLEKVKSGKIDESVIDERIERILTMMERIKLGDKTRNKGCTNTKDHQQTIQQIAEEGIVLLKNDTAHLPLSKETKKILVLGDNAKRTHAAGGGSAEIKTLYDISPLLGMRMVLGGDAQIDWLPGYYVDNEKHVAGEVDWQAESLDVDYTTDRGKEQFDKEIRPIREKYLKEALDACPSYDEVIFIGGLNHAYDVEGFDRPDMTLPYGQNEVIEALTEKCKNLTVVLINGGPVEMPWINKANSLIQTSYCGMHGGLALARILFGEVNPSGHLAETYPVHLCDTPTEKFKSYPGTVDNSGQRHVEYTEKLMVGYRYYETEEIPVLFPFGYGLSYTTFDLHDFSVEKNDDETVCCHCRITNTRNRAGSQTIQLYVGIPEEGQPKKQLKAFKKVALAPQETKHVSLCLEKKDFATYNCKNQTFVINEGTYSLWIGTSVKDIFFQSEVTLSQSGMVK